MYISINVAIYVHWIYKVNWRKLCSPPIEKWNLWPPPPTDRAGRKPAPEIATVPVARRSESRLLSPPGDGWSYSIEDLMHTHKEKKEIYINIYVYRIHMYMIQSPGRMLWRSPSDGPIQQPWIWPKLVMDMPLHSGIWCCTQFLTASTFYSAQITEVRIVTHLLGLRVMPSRSMYIFV